MDVVTRDILGVMVFSCFNKFYFSDLCMMPYTVDITIPAFSKDSMTQQTRGTKHDLACCLGRGNPSKSPQFGVL